MTFSGRVIGIQIVARHGEPLTARDEVQAEAGRGLLGDRYCRATPTAGPAEPNHITLIEDEALAAANQDYGLALSPLDTRRNLLTLGVPLNHLVGRKFRVGEAELEGVELCEPCGHLEKLTCQGAKRALIHRGGLRAAITKGGRIRCGDEVRVEEQ